MKICTSMKMMMPSSIVVMAVMTAVRILDEEQERLLWGVLEDTVVESSVVFSLMTYT